MSLPLILATKKMKKHIMIFALLLAVVAITGCGDAHSPSHKADEHEGKLQLTAYVNDF